MNIGKYVIGFPGTERVKKFFERNKEASTFTLIDAVNGRNLPFSLIENVFSKKFVQHQLKHKNQDWLKGTLGCLFSHIKAIEQAQTDGVDYALIVEDDAVLKTNPDNIFHIANNLGYDIVYVNDGMSLNRKARINEDFSIIELTILNLKGTGTVGYILSKKAMVILLELFSSGLEIRLPCGFDGMLQSTVLKQNDMAIIGNARAKSYLWKWLEVTKKYLTESNQNNIEQISAVQTKKGLWECLKIRKTDLKVGVSSPTIILHVDDGKSLIRAPTGSGSFQSESPH